MLRHRLCALIAVTSVVALAGLAPARAGQGYVIVVNRANPTGAVSRAELSKLFLKRATRWPGGAAAVPYDLSGASATRKAFTEGIHGKPMWVVVAFWQQEIASGRTQPPVVCATEEAALRAVSNDPGGVAYVSEGVALLPGVKALTVAP